MPLLDPLVEWRDTAEEIVWAWTYVNRNLQNGKAQRKKTGKKKGTEYLRTVGP